jgi:hypothetical protein
MSGDEGIKLANLKNRLGLELHFGHKLSLRAYRLLIALKLLENYSEDLAS